MALFVLCEPEYMHTAECTAKIKGICDEALRYRFRRPHILSDLQTAKELVQASDADASVILLFDSLFWLQEAAKALSDCRAHIILSADYIDLPLPIRYSQVGVDVDNAVHTAIDYLHSCNKHSFALLCANTDSCNDHASVAMLKKYLSPEEYRVFYAEDPLAGGIETIAASLQDFDAVLCANQFLAIHLSEHLQAEATPFILSLTDGEVLGLHRGGISAFSAQYNNCGRKLMETHRHRNRCGFSTRITLLPTTLEVRGSTENIPFVPSENLSLPVQHTSLAPPQNNRLPAETVNRLEHLLLSGDLIQLKVMYCVLCGYDRNKTKDFCFISSETARYRVNKLRMALGVETKSEATDILRKYIQKDRLFAVIDALEAQG